MGKVILMQFRHQVFESWMEAFDQSLLLLNEVGLYKRPAGLTLNIRKNKFAMKKLRYLARIICEKLTVLILPSLIFRVQNCQTTTKVS